MRIRHIKDNDTWKKIKNFVPTIHVYKNIYLVRQYTYEHHKIARWIIVFIEREEKVVDK